MNKFIAVLLVVLGVAAVQVAAGKGHEKFKKIAEECKAQEQASDDDVKNFFKMSEPLATPKGKCFAGCVYEKMGVLVNGAYSKANCDKWIEEKFADDKDKQDKAKAAMASCESELAGVPKEKCQTGPAMRKCMARLMKSHKKNGGEGRE